jgi:Homeodomain-like domain
MVLLTMEAAMSKLRYVVNLSAQERVRLEDLIRKGKSPARRQLKARILLQADLSAQGAGWSDARISAGLSTYPAMCARVRRQWHEAGLDAVLTRKQRASPPVPRIFDGAQEAQLIALACSPPPQGHAQWTLRLLESRVVELNIVDHASDNTIGRVLKKMRSSRISGSNGSSPRVRTALL